MKKCIHFMVEGLVQGVCYRANAQRQAEILGITGWIKNHSKGHVEVLACGEEDQIHAFHQWLWQGPRLSKVIKVTQQEEPYQEFSGFDIVYD